MTTSTPTGSSAAGSSPAGSSPAGSSPAGSSPAGRGAASPAPKPQRGSLQRSATKPTRPRRTPAADKAGDEWRRYAAELIGTALLVVVGVGVAVLAPGVGALGIALAFGLVLTVLAYTIGPISGCHVNPAVTLGMALAGRIPARRGIFYVVSQIVGAIIGAAIVLAVANNRPDYTRATNGLGTNGWGEHSPGGYGLTAAAIVEIVLTAVLVLTVLQVTSDKYSAQIAGLPIGLALLVAHLVAVPIDGTSVNPARSIGPALLQGGAALSQLWLFIVAPLVGAVLAVAAHKALPLRSEDDEDNESTRRANDAPAKAAPSGTAATTTGSADQGSAGGKPSRKQRTKSRRKRR
jgi:aquaporin Z